MFGTWEIGTRVIGQTAKRVGLESYSRCWKTSTTKDSLKTTGSTVKVASSLWMVS